jgi:lipoprotein-anchoring transpeptidase ErfK/SrfK
MGSQDLTAERATRGLARSRPLLIAAGTVLALGALAACSTGAPGGGSPASEAGTSHHSPSPSASAQPSSSHSPSQDGPPLATVTASASGESVNPIAPISVKATGGLLSSVVMHNASGKQVTGKLAANDASWHTTEVLGYGKTYTIRAKARNAAGMPTVKTSQFTTLTPPNMTMPYIDDEYGGAIKNGGTYGVGMVVNVVFDEPIIDKAAAEKTLHVSTSPHVTGSWYWVDNTHVHWRPKHFYKPGTKVTVNAKVYGHEVSHGLYGQSDVSTSFTIGRKQKAIVNDTAPRSVNKVRVYRSGKLVRTMNTSMGEHKGETVKGKYINFYTLDGTYTVLGFENPAKMCSDTYGLPSNADGGYPCEKIPWATKISTDGIYLHELDTTIWDQNHGRDVSHGCLNLNHANAHWYYTHSMVGDPVVVHGAKGAPKLQAWQGGDWSLAWSQWLRGSALH